MYVRILGNNIYKAISMSWKPLSHKCKNIQRNINQFESPKK